MKRLLKGSGFNYPHTQTEREMGRETVFEGEKESWCLGKYTKTCQSCIYGLTSDDMDFKICENLNGKW